MTENNFLSDAISKIIPDLQDLFQKTAEETGWSSDVSSSISLKNSPNGVQMQYPSSMEETLLDLEFGNKNIPPKAAVRTFVYKAEEMMAEAIHTATLDNLLQNEVYQ